MLIQAQKQTKNETDTNDKGINIDPKTYCKLGHFHLLLADYPKGKYACYYRILLSLFMIFALFQPCQLIKNSDRWGQIIGKIQTSCTGSG